MLRREQLDIKLGLPFDIPINNDSQSILYITMLWIPSGNFMMGSPLDEIGRSYEDGEPFFVTLSQGFWLSKFLVTQAQWGAVTGSNPSYFDQINADCPVESITWDEAVQFCELLNREYQTDLSASYRFSLPSESQWEYACKIGATLGRVDQTVDLSTIAWHKGNSFGRTHPVGKKLPNEVGLYDMLGNVCVWCLDTPTDYPKDTAVDWVSTDRGELHGLRGAAWSAPPGPVDFRCSAGGFADRNTRRPWIGMRLCLSSLKAA